MNTRGVNRDEILSRTLYERETDEDMVEINRAIGKIMELCAGDPTYYNQCDGIFEWLNDKWNKSDDPSALLPSDDQMHGMYEILRSDADEARKEIIVFMLLIIVSKTDRSLHLFITPERVQHFNLLLQGAESEGMVCKLIRLMSTITSHANEMQIHVEYCINNDALCRTVERFPDVLDPLMDACPLFLHKCDMTKQYFREILCFCLNRCPPARSYKFLVMLHEYADSPTGNPDPVFRALIDSGFVAKLRVLCHPGREISYMFDSPEDAKTVQLVSLGLMMRLLRRSEDVRSYVRSFIDFMDAISIIVLDKYQNDGDESLSDDVSIAAFVLVRELSKYGLCPTNTIVQLEPLVVACIQNGAFKAREVGVYMASLLVSLEECQEISSAHMFQIISDMVGVEDPLCQYALLYVDTALRRTEQKGEVPTMTLDLLDRLDRVADDQSDNDVANIAKSISLRSRAYVPER